MTNNIKVRAIILLFSFISIITACKKPEKGDTGPAGPAGKDGNANVKSTTLSVTSANWVAASTEYSVVLNVPAITQDIIDKGAVLVYIQTGTSTWSQLPLTYYSSSAYSSTMEVVSYVGGVQIIATDSDLTQPNNPGSWTFKVVALSGSYISNNPQWRTQYQLSGKLIN